MIITGIIFIGITYVKGVSDKNPKIVIDDEGISATELGEQKILWINIKNANIVRYPRVGRILTLELYDESKYTAETPDSKNLSHQINRAFGLTTFSIIIEGLDTSPTRIHQEILTRIHHAQLTSPYTHLSNQTKK